MATYVQAINQALAQALEQDPRVCVLGEDVAAGGAFGATRGLVEQFGFHRVRNTPISENAIVGLSVGAATAGLRPIVEVMFIDFATLAMDPLVNHAAKLRFMSGGQLSVPLVVRTQAGAIGGAAAQHSQSLEAWFCHVPGLKVVSPATPSDALGLLLAAINDSDPVLVIEPKRSNVLREDLPTVGEPISLGRAHVRRAGDDVTVVTYGSGVLDALAVAERLASHGTSVEVIDLRTLKPFDVDTVATSLARTRHLVVHHEAPRAGGLGAEIFAALHCRGVLPAAARRSAAPDIPVPASVDLERELMPGEESLTRELGKLLA